ncbi:uncharacterized protein LOC134571056 [Pelobates fuscus]|uniref:uncharacterized protein LOC134571056 n=1 Tax=Pelobates fuscus TaxID=191477 RepID=UPI002FE44CC9
MTRSGSELTERKIAICFWNKQTDLSWLANELSMYSSIMTSDLVSCVPMFIITEKQERNEILNKSQFIICYCNQSQIYQNDVESFLDLCVDKKGSQGLAVVIDDMKDEYAIEEMSDRWRRKRFSCWELLLFTKNNLDFINLHKSQSWKSTQQELDEILKAEENKGLGVIDDQELIRIPNKLSNTNIKRRTEKVSGFQKFCQHYNRGTIERIHRQLSKLETLVSDRVNDCKNEENLSSYTEMSSRLKEPYSLQQRQKDSEIPKIKFTKKEREKRQVINNDVQGSGLPVGIFSRSAESDYEWLQTLLSTERFGDQGLDVQSFYISNNGMLQFIENLSKCKAGILYHTKNSGRINITNVMDSLYDMELKLMSDMLGRDKVFVVIDDLENSSAEEKLRILRTQPRIGEYAADVVLVTEIEKMDREILLRKLERTIISQQEKETMSL